MPKFFPDPNQYSHNQEDQTKFSQEMVHGFVIRYLLLVIRTSPQRITLNEYRITPSRLSVMVGLSGLEPLTLRLSSACSNQLSYRPARSFKSKFEISNWCSWWS